jgi:hypothetical protein
VTGKEVDKVVQKAKKEFAAFAPDAIDFYRECFRRNSMEDQTEKGIFKDDEKAMWATEKVSKGLGLTEPEHAIRPQVVIQLGFIKAEVAQVQSDDSDAARAAKAIDVTPETAEAP